MKDIQIIIVIPCFREPNILPTLQSLSHCVTEASTEFAVYIVVNAPENACAEVVHCNQDTLETIREFAKTAPYPIECMAHLALPIKQAGVGLARKIGMDAAAQYFTSHAKNGIIACLDADTTVAPNYIAAIRQAFHKHPEHAAANIYFEHPLNDDFHSKEVRHAITQYELHLRYFIGAQRYAGFPHAFQTIGSAMAVRSAAYLRQGGMNRRKAGEDFYFLHKFITIGRFFEIMDTKVIPSPRSSARVPFGTGRAVGQALSGQDLSTYHFQLFEDLSAFLPKVPQLFESSSPLTSLAPWLQSYLSAQQFEQVVLPELRRHTASQQTFVQRFFHWFNAFRLMKCVHYGRDHAHENADILIQAQHLAQAMQLSQCADAACQLRIFREWDQSQQWLHSSSGGRMWLQYIAPLSQNNNQ